MTISTHFTLIFLWITCSVLVISDIVKEIEIVAINSLSSSSGKTITGAQWIAIDEINNNTELLPNYKFTLKRFDTEGGQPNVALNHILTLLKSTDDEQCDTNDTNISSTATIFPIVLGVSRSSLSTLVSSVLGVNNMGLISSVSTSVVLSDTSAYPYFYRTIASDALQSKGIVFLCNAFNWKSIVVVYANDAYGLYLSLGIQELGKMYDIDVSSVAIQYEDALTYSYAAKQVRAINKYIIVLIHNSGGITGLLEAFEAEGLTQYPYYYLGVDSWLDSSVINEEFGAITQGFIGTLPWNIHQFEKEDYDEDIGDVINATFGITAALLDKWQYVYQHTDILAMETPRAYVVYAYDVMYSIIYCIQEFEREYGVGSLVNMIEHNSTEFVIQLLDEIMTNKVDFYGASGHMKFEQNGDRENGFFSFGNILANGSINYFGYFLENTDAENATGLDSIQAHIDVDEVIFPAYFTEKGLIPHSQIIIHTKILVIHDSLSMFMFIFTAILSVFVFGCMVFVVLYREHPIIKRSSWFMNIIMCFGVLLSFISVAIFGIDEMYMVQQDALDRLCVFQWYLISVSFTVTMMPLFLKTWRLVKIFGNTRRVKRISDKTLSIYICIVVLIDLVLLTICIVLEPVQRLYEKGELIEMDALQNEQRVFGVCSGFNLTTSIIVILCKLAQVLFGVYCALNVARIHTDSNANKNLLVRFVKFDETSAQLGSIALIFIILCIFAFVASFVPNDEVSWKYGVIAFTIVFIGIMVFLLNLSFRIIAVIKKQKNIQSVEDQFKDNLKNMLLDMKLDGNSTTSVTAATNTDASIVRPKQTELPQNLNNDTQI